MTHMKDIHSIVEQHLAGNATSDDVVRVVSELPSEEVGTALHFLRDHDELAYAMIEHSGRSAIEQN